MSIKRITACVLALMICLRTPVCASAADVNSLGNEQETAAVEGETAQEQIEEEQTAEEQDAEEQAVEEQASEETAPEVTAPEEKAPEETAAEETAPTLDAVQNVVCLSLFHSVVLHQCRE